MAKIANPVWLASYPRSGNTFLRTILFQCFGLRSASVYLRDLGGNKELEDFVGHIEHEQENRILFPPNAIPLIKTHELDTYGNPAIYVIRDGRAASVSLWNFYNRNISLEEVIEGRHRFGTWANHVESWNPWERPNTLLLRYESMKTDLPQILEEISDFLQCDIRSASIPDRNTIAGTDGRWVKGYRDWRSDITEELMMKFDRINGDVLRKAGYTN